MAPVKAMGAVPAAFAAPGPLVIGGRPAAEWAAEGDTPLFVYDLGMVAARAAALRAALPGVDIHYAIKANPLPAMVAAVAPWFDGLDVASDGELAIALGAKPAAAISFAGPGKRVEELEAAIRAGATINLESVGEADRALAAGGRLGITPRLAVRVNPDFELRGSGMKMGGRASPFGIDVDEAPGVVRRLRAAGADWRGWHIFAGSQSLDSAAIIETQAATIALAARLSDQVGAAPPLVNLGGGFGIPYFAGDRAIDLPAIGDALASALAARPAILAPSRFAIELGRYIVGECGVYLTRVIERKVSRGETFLVVDGGLHHQLAASGNFGTVVKRNYPVAVATAAAEAPTETVSVVGCLCTPLDRLADRVTLPVAAPGDLIAVFMAGAYGLSASPSGFLGHRLPAELLAYATRS
ncbi:pyridoxal-dependent decarboxylase, exosortase A system-associated [Sphingomonas hylomeconis]|uniref:Pyridoxal-dependent decarboxylase, exosortase A system-associated n=1 Tax=Sphingomonas hylomeconis TaxID=1395958 RepID=A0ABV7SWU5_9SPHN|nr:pyridoxal-dependent decarboxylase, exosortase A system-associated [Sphingomonas hylomeconis]